MTSADQINMFDDSVHLPAQSLAKHLNYGMQERHLREVPGILGLYYSPGFLNDDAQREVVKRIAAQHWRKDLGRRVQHYGWRYDYRSRTITSDMYLGPLPDWITEIAERLHAETELFDRIPEQVIVNEYEPGQGIALHTDRTCFGDAVATISLGDNWEMKLRPVRGTPSEDKRLMLERGSVLIMTGEARFRWMHGIDKRKTEGDKPNQRDRQRRLSLTFRTVINQSSELRSTENHAITT